MKVWDLTTGEAILSLSGRGGTFSPEGRHLATVRGDQTIQIRNLDTDQVDISLAGHTDVVTALAFSREGNRLASTSWDRTVKIWDLKTGQELRTLQGHTGPVWSVAFSPDGQRLASASLDMTQWGKGEVKIWDAATGKHALTLHGNACVAFSPDGSRLAALHTDFYLASEVKVWDAQVVTPAVRAARREAAHQAATARHRRLGEECLATEQWQAALFHLSRALDARPGQAELHARRGQAHAALGQWEQAAADTARAIELGRVDGSLWFQHALLLLARADQAGYRRHCARLLERFGQTENPQLALWVVWNCKLTADAVPDFAPLVPLAERAVASRPRDAFSLNHLGGILYRAGRHEEALQRLTEAMQARRDGSFIWEWIWLAMAHQRLGHAEEARKWLQQAAQWIDEAARNGRLSWEWRLELRLLRREAEELIR